jgi:uncharacterized protein YheU (UPF0270 family)
MTDDEEARGAEVSPDDLSPEALRGLLEEFVTRDGTDYGAIERGLEEKIAQVMAQLRAGEARIVFDPASETANIVLAQDLPA